MELSLKDLSSAALSAYRSGAHNKAVSALTTIQDQMVRQGMGSDPKIEHNIALARHAGGLLGPDDQQQLRKELVEIRHSIIKAARAAAAAADEGEVPGEDNGGKDGKDQEKGASGSGKDSKKGKGKKGGSNKESSSEAAAASSADPVSELLSGPNGDFLALLMYNEAVLMVRLKQFATALVILEYLFARLGPANADSTALRVCFLLLDVYIRCVVHPTFPFYRTSWRLFFASFSSHPL